MNHLTTHNLSRTTNNELWTTAIWQVTTGNRQQTTGNCQLASGNRQPSTGNRQLIIMQNKPNFPRAAMFLKFYSKKDYENEPSSARQQNEPKQTQFVAAQPSCHGEVLYEAGLAKPDQTQFQSRPILTDPMKPGFFNSCKNSLTDSANWLK
jgi:hypothetical protein